MKTQSHPMLHPGVTRRRDREKTRAALLDAAGEVFARRGFDGASLEEIAETAGFTRGAVYHHFASKEQLFLNVIARHDEELSAAYSPDLLDRFPVNASKRADRWRELHQTDRREVALRLELRSHSLRNPRLCEEFLAVDRAAVSATAVRLAGAQSEIGGRWRYPVELVAELLQRAELTGDDKTPLMALLLSLLQHGLVDTSSGAG
jgi:AcrR family transcriptional regulator